MAIQKDSVAELLTLNFLFNHWVLNCSLKQKHIERWEQETNARAKRLSSGLKGIWHRLTGKYAKAIQQNEMEALQPMQRDRKEKDDLIFNLEKSVEREKDA